MVDVRTKVEVSGPIFDGRAQQAVDDYLDQAEKVVAEAGVEAVRGELRRVLRNPTGYYESRITEERAQDDYAVTDDRVVYGPWLAGVGSMNQVTGFKGYDHWERATTELQSKADQLAEGALRPYLDRMNG